MERRRYGKRWPQRYGHIGSDAPRVAVAALDGSELRRLLLIGKTVRPPSNR